MADIVTRLHAALTYPQCIDDLPSLLRTALDEINALRRDANLRMQQRGNAAVSYDPKNANPALRSKSAGLGSEDPL